MEVRAKVRYVRMSPQKGRLVADMVRGKKVNEALNILRFTNKATAKVIGKLIVSAKSNAEVKNVSDPEEMKINTIYINQGPVMKRQLSRAKGRVDVIRKPLSHITVVLEEVEEPKKKKQMKAKTQTKTQTKKLSSTVGIQKDSKPKADAEKVATTKAVEKKIKAGAESSGAESEKSGKES